MEKNSKEHAEYLVDKYGWKIVYGLFALALIILIIKIFINL